jgi:His-Xaa-Ser system radical SAM maturase HxsC
MSIPLWARALPANPTASSRLGRVVRSETPDTVRADSFLLTDNYDRVEVKRGWAGLLTSQRLEGDDLSACRDATTLVFHSLSPSHYLEAGDVVAGDPTGIVRTLYRRDSEHNTILATEACNSFCTMCSQPPRNVEARARMQEHLRLLELIDPATRELGISGGEPTLLKSDLVRLARRARELLPRTALHILSNGRLFYYGSLARDLAAVKHPSLMLGIPIYSDVDFIHDFVVQAAGAHAQTLVGLQNLARWGVKVEIRVVLHRYTVDRLQQLAEFVCRNLPFASHVALMGLEPMGFAVPNYKHLWIDPFEYRRELEDATRILANFGLEVSIFNHQLCVVPEALWPYCVKSISDWKNEYLPECSGCGARGNCGGFFSSSLARGWSSHIFPIDGQAEPVARREP